MSIKTRVVKLEGQAAKIGGCQQLSPQEVADKLDKLFLTVKERQGRIEAGLDSDAIKGRNLADADNSGMDDKTLAAKIAGIYFLAKSGWQ